MFYGTYDRTVRADRYRKVAAEYTELSKLLPIHISAPITFASPRIIKTRPNANCGRWSERGSARRPMARAHKRKPREDSDHRRKGKPGAAHLQPAYSPGDEAFPGEPLLMGALARWASPVPPGVSSGESTLA